MMFLRTLSAAVVLASAASDVVALPSGSSDVAHPVSALTGRGGT